MDRIAELDGLRGIAILSVLFLHFGMFQPQGHAEAALFRFFEMGWAGVDLFFVLSGFLITTILLKSKDATDYYSRFYIRRFFRIFPIYYAFLSVFLAVQLWQHRPVLEQIWYWTYTANFRIGMGHRVPVLNHFWSLAIEEQFYLFWPLVIKKLRAPKLVGFCVVLCLMSFLLRYSISGSQTPGSDFVYCFTLCRVDSLAFGAVVAILFQTRAGWPLIRWLERGSLGFGVLAVLYAVSSSHSTLYVNPQLERFGYSGVDLLSAGLVMLAVRKAGTKSLVLLRSQFLRTFGKYSYGLYVVHMPIAVYLCPQVQRIFGMGPASAAISIIVGSLLSFLAALLSWTLLERKFLALKERLTAPANLPLAAAASAS